MSQNLAYVETKQINYTLVHVSGQNCFTSEMESHKTGNFMCEASEVWRNQR